MLKRNIQTSVEKSQKSLCSIKFHRGMCQHRVVLHTTRKVCRVQHLPSFFFKY